MLILQVFFSGFLTFVNCYDVKETSKMQNVFMFAKIAALLIIIATGLSWVAMGKNAQTSFNAKLIKISSY